MGILAECPICRKMRSLKVRICKCGENIETAKRSRRVNYYVNFKLPDGRQRRELVGKSIEEARAADGKRRDRRGKGGFSTCCRNRK